MIVAIILPYAGLVRFLRIIRAFSGVFRLVGASHVLRRCPSSVKSPTSPSSSSS